MSELKECPFCGCEEVSLSEIMPNMVLCSNIDCYFYAVYTPVMIWQSRPIEDGLRAELNRRDDVIKRLKEAGENLIQLANFNNKKAVYYTETWSALMKELK